jgi:hypothetical protein
MALRTLVGAPHAAASVDCRSLASIIGGSPEGPLRRRKKRFASPAVSRVATPRCLPIKDFVAPFLAARFFVARFFPDSSREGLFLAGTVFLVPPSFFAFLVAIFGSSGATNADRPTGFNCTATFVHYSGNLRHKGTRRLKQLKHTAGYLLLSFDWAINGCRCRK